MQPAAEVRATRKRVRYAVVGLGHIAQAAVLPGFANAQHNSQLAALVSDDPTKLIELGDRYGIEQRYSYDDYERCLKSGLIDAVYIALPNDMHCEFSVHAAETGVHVLCEKPMAATEEECEEMIASAEGSQVQLMIAYRLHFDKANLKAVELIQSGSIGEPRLFTSLFTNDVREGGIRLQRERGGGALYDIGIYCINAVRYLWREPSGYEGLADVRIIEALYRSAAEQWPVTVEPVDKRKRPSMEQHIERPPVEMQPLVHTESPMR